MGEPHTGHYPRECSSTKMHITIGSSFIKKKRTAALKESSFAVVPCPSVICLRLRSGFSICICPHGADDFLSYIFSIPIHISHYLSTVHIWTRVGLISRKKRSLSSVLFELFHALVSLLRCASWECVCQFTSLFFIFFIFSFSRSRKVFLRSMTRLSFTNDQEEKIWLGLASFSWPVWSSHKKKDFFGFTLLHCSPKNSRVPNGYCK